jgi:NAD(P)H-hydrate epimerase
MRALDRRAIADLGIPGAVLMERAGRAAAEVLLELLAGEEGAGGAAAGGPARRAGAARRTARVAVVCGKGGNGGDGFVLARFIARRGHRPSVLLLARADEVRGDAALKLRDLRRAGIRPRVVGDDAALAMALAGADVVVDALLGTGSRGAPAAPVAAAIERINASGRPVLALDVPSGLPADGGAPAGPVVRATVTVTFAGLKLGLIQPPGTTYAGRVRVVPIGIPPAEVARGITTFLTERADVAAHFPPRPPEAHKGTYGHLLVVAGSLGKTGAAALAARAALRSGAGLVTVATPASQQPVVAGLLLEAMTEALPETPAHTAALAALPTIAALARARDAVAVGPGLGLEPQTQELARALARELDRPLVIDADALSALAGHVNLLKEAVAERCLTPHPGEMARMLGVGVAEVQRDRIATARAFARERRVHLLLKGAATVVAAPDGTVWLNATGNPGMASGGTGDVLTGMVGAFLARGLPGSAALQAAAWLHGRAGDLAAARVGEESLVAGDVIEALPDAFRGLADGAG